MAPQSRPLNQTERDLHRYANDKAYHFIRDVMQSFEIAHVPGTEALACIGATMMRLAATLAVHSDADHERWMKYCDHVFNLALEAKEDEDDNED